jgi:transposase
VCFCDTWEVYKVEVYGRVRRSVQVDGMSERQAAREYGLSRKTIRKMMAYSAPPGYQRKKPVARPKLGPWLGVVGQDLVVDQILADDESRPKKQRHTARRIYDRLKQEHSFTGGYTIVKDYVRDARLRHKEVFVPLVHPPGDAQADFGEALVVISGVEQKAHFLCVDLPHSDDAFVVAFPAENTESFCEGHNQAFAYLGGVPRSILYDNTAIAVKEITGDGERKPTEEFSRLKSHYLFETKFGRPGKGNDKGNVEGLVGYARRNFMVPVPRAVSWEELNTQLVEECRQRRARKLWGHRETIAMRFERDREKLLPLPAVPYEACEKRPTRVSSQALVRYETNDYSVPVKYGHQRVLLKAFVWDVVIACGSEVIARHKRSYNREEMIFDPLHRYCDCWRPSLWPK